MQGVAAVNYSTFDALLARPCQTVRVERWQAGDNHTKL
jgi:hypothetical protein